MVVAADCDVTVVNCICTYTVQCIKILTISLFPSLLALIRKRYINRSLTVSGFRIITFDCFRFKCQRFSVESFVWRQSFAEISRLLLRYFAMDKRIVIRYEDNNSSRYDGKQFYELSSRVRRINGSKDRNFRVGEVVTVKTKSRVWKRQILPAAGYVRAVQKRPCADSKVELCTASRNS